MGERKFGWYVVVIPLGLVLLHHFPIIIPIVIALYLYSQYLGWKDR